MSTPISELLIFSRPLKDKTAQLCFTLRWISLFFVSSTSSLFRSMGDIGLYISSSVLPGLHSRSLLRHIAKRCSENGSFISVRPYDSLRRCVLHRYRGWNVLEDSTNFGGWNDGLQWSDGVRPGAIRNKTHLLTQTQCRGGQ